MERVTDANIGDEYRIVEPGFAGNYAFVRKKKDGTVRVRNLETAEERWISYHDFERMKSVGSLIRTVRDGVRTATDSLGPFSILDPEDQSVGLKLRSRRRRARANATQAMTLHFYVTRFDKSVSVTQTENVLKQFIEENYEDAVRSGFEWLPSTSAMRRALHIGKPHNRPLGLFLQRRSHKKQRWPQWVLELKAEAINFFWKGQGNKTTAVDYFISRFNDVRRAREAYKQKCPGRQTVHDWLRASENKDTFAQKYGTRNAHKRYVGTVPTLQADKPLEYVVVDQTLTDIWLVVEDVKGNIIGRQRPWLVYAMDVYSRMVLGFSLTFEPPSTHSLMKCLKHSLQYKSELVAEFGDHKGATDGYGKGETYIFDNGPENIGVSAQTALQNVGCSWLYASLKTPEHKAWVERLFGTTNGLWHQLPGGRPGGKDKNKFPEADAQELATLTLPEAIRRLRQFIVTVYHVEVSSGIGMAPARKWAEGVQKHGRQSVDDIAVLDRVLGSYKRVALTTSGVRLDNQVFHDPGLTTKLIHDLASSRKQREQRGLGQSMVLRASAIVNPMDCSSITIVNELSGTLVKLPNVHAGSTVELSFEHANQLRKYAHEKNLAFHSEDDRIEARRALFFDHEEAIRRAPNPTKRAIRTYAAEALTLRDDGVILEGEVEPSVTGMNGHTISTSAPVTLRRNHGLEPIGPVRGKRNARAKAPPTETEPAISQFVEPPSRESPPPKHYPKLVRGLSSEDEATAFLDRLAEKKMERW